MARGWESKAVEEQVNDREADRDADRNAVRVGDAERERERKLRSLQLSRTRIADQLAAATNPAYRHTLERGLVALDEQIASAANDPSSR